MPQPAAVERRRRVVLGVAVGVVAALVGLFSFALLPYGAMAGVAGIVVGAVGAVGVVRRESWGVVGLCAGIGLAAGTAGYVVLGLLQSGAPACGGTGCP